MFFLLNRFLYFYFLDMTFESFDEEVLSMGGFYCHNKCKLGRRIGQCLTTYIGLEKIKPHTKYSDQDVDYINNNNNDICIVPNAKASKCLKRSVKYTVNERYDTNMHM